MSAAAMAVPMLLSGTAVAGNAATHALRSRADALAGRCYLLRSFSTGFGLAGCCGRRNEDAAWAGFLSAFGFLASRCPRSRLLATAVLLVVRVPVTRTIGRKGAGAYGALSAALSAIAARRGMMTLDMFSPVRSRRRRTPRCLQRTTCVIALGNRQAAAGGVRVYCRPGRSQANAGAPDPHCAGRGARLIWLNAAPLLECQRVLACGRLPWRRVGSGMAPHTEPAFGARATPAEARGE
jgi:hypothetical protein